MNPNQLAQARLMAGSGRGATPPQPPAAGGGVPSWMSGPRSAMPQTGTFGQMGGMAGAPPQPGAQVGSGMGGLGGYGGAAPPMPQSQQSMMARLQQMYQQGGMGGMAAGLDQYPAGGGQPTNSTFQRSPYAMGGGINPSAPTQGLVNMYNMWQGNGGSNAR
jgi:hypothetical protein